MAGNQTALSQMRDQAEAIARQIGPRTNANPNGATVDEILQQLQRQAASQTYIDSGDPAVAAQAALYNEQSARRNQAALSRANGIPAQGESFIDGISNPVSQLNSTLPQYKGPQSLAALRNDPNAGALMPDAATFQAMAAGMPQAATPALSGTIADAYSGIRNSQTNADAMRAEQHAATQRALTASMGQDYNQLLDVYKPGELTAKVGRHDRNNISQRNALADLRMSFNNADANARIAENQSPLNLLSHLRDLFDAGLGRRIHDSLAGGRNLPPRPADVPSATGPRNV